MSKETFDVSKIVVGIPLQTEQGSKEAIQYEKSGCQGGSSTLHGHVALHMQPSYPPT